MGSPGWTKKLCHGCGEAKLHRKDKLCADCQRIFDDGVRAREKQEKQQDKIIVKHDERPFLISGAYLFENSGSFIGSNIKDKFRSAWGALTMAVLEPAVGGRHNNAPYLITNKRDTWGVENDFYGYYDDEFFLVSPSVKDKLNELDLAIRLALKYVYLAGRRQGLDILKGLNEGSVSISKYEDALDSVSSQLEKIGEQVKEQT